MRRTVCAAQGQVGLLPLTVTVTTKLLKSKCHLLWCVSGMKSCWMNALQQSLVLEHEHAIILLDLKVFWTMNMGTKSFLVNFIFEDHFAYVQ